MASSQRSNNVQSPAETTALVEPQQPQETRTPPHRGSHGEHRRRPSSSELEPAGPSTSLSAAVPFAGETNPIPPSEHYKATMPYAQFRKQADRERARLEIQLSQKDAGRRQTLPYDYTLDLLANSENNIRQRWTAQGIWAESWGPEWPSPSHPLTQSWNRGRGGPFVGNFCPMKFHSTRWGHERYYDDSELVLTSKVVQQLSTRSSIDLDWGVRAPKTCVANPQASRPYHQFLYQLSKEREWIRDELLHANNRASARNSASTSNGASADIDDQAYQSLKANWVRDDIWDDAWGHFPGVVWRHELVELVAWAATIGPDEANSHGSQPSSNPGQNTQVLVGTSDTAQATAEASSSVPRSSAPAPAPATSIPSGSGATQETARRCGVEVGPVTNEPTKKPGAKGSLSSSPRRPSPPSSTFFSSPPLLLLLPPLFLLMAANSLLYGNDRIRSMRANAVLQSR